MNQKKILITSALPYANGPLHFGHIAGAYLPGDCYARFERLQGNDTLYICGSDEHGFPITLNAELAKRTPQEHVDHYHQVNVDFFKKLNFSFDHYSRTTWKKHKFPVQQFFLDLLANGYIEEKVTDQLYSEEEKRFFADRYVIGTCPSCGYDKARGDECPQCAASYEAVDLIHPKAKLTGSALTLKPTKHWFLRLDLFKDKLVSWLDEKEWKPNVLNFVKNYIKDLRPRAITRDSDWGIPVPLPNTEGKVLYVWFDAPIGYISATMEWAEKNGDPDLWKKYWNDQETVLVNFIGKDNIPFHSVIFPAMVMGQNQPYKLVDELPANEFYMLEGRQFSKSEGWYIDLDDFFKRYTADQIRYAIAASAPETSDSEFTWKEFQQRCNAELLGKYGNLVNRIFVFAHKNVNGIIPDCGSLCPIDQEFLDAIQQSIEQARVAYSHFSLRRATQAIIELAQKGNVYFDAKQPWKMAKEPGQKEALGTTIFCCLECLKALALISFPIIPETASKVWKMLGNEKELEEGTWQEIASTPVQGGSLLKQPEILFQKIEEEQVEEELRKLRQFTKEMKQEEQKMSEIQKKDVQFEPVKAAIDFDQFDKLDLRIGTIIAAVPVEKSKKLFKIQVDLGFEERTIVSGIRQHYQAEDLVGKKVVVVANLKPAKLMGVESQGMLLCGLAGDHLELLSVEGLPSGSSVR